MSSILRRIHAEAGQDLAAALLALPPRDLRSLLLHVLRERAAEVDVAEARRRSAALGATHPSPVDARLIHRIEGHLLAAAAAFEALDLSPVVPHGAARALGGTHPDLVLGALRGLEVAGDPSTALAFEAVRRRGRPQRLCAVQRVMRMQPVRPPLVPHFKLFACASAVLAEEVFAELRRHLEVQLEGLARLRDDGFKIAAAVAEVSDPACVAALLRAAGVDSEEIRGLVSAHRANGAELLRARGVVLGDEGALPPRLRQRVARLREEVLEPAAARFPWAARRVDLGRLEGLGYYSGPTLRVTITNPAGETFAIADGGVLDWTGRLLGDGSQRLVTSGMGVELLGIKFR